MKPAQTPTLLLTEVRQLIDAARQKVASTVNAELTQLYWQIGNRINVELLQGQRAQYGKQIVSDLALQLTVEFGAGWSERQLRYCLRLLIQIDEPLAQFKAEASFSILDGSVISGQLPLNRARLVQAWIEIHRDDLIADWNLAIRGEAPFPIDPLR
jgi:hypothetical protein